MNMMMDGWSMMIFMFLSGLLLVTVFVAIVVLLVQWFLGSQVPFSAKERDNALQILKTRYAKGEIGGEEFETIRRDIEK